MRDFRKALASKQLVFDGATGTMLQRLGLKPGGCPDELCLKDPALVRKVHSAYIGAGSDIVTTNTFGGNRPKLMEYGLEGRLAEINIAAARCARDEAGSSRFVAGGLGPTGRFVEPVGEMPFDEAFSVFKEQAQALKEGGADLVIIETMMDIREMKAAIMGAKSTGLPVVATMTFDETMRTVLGTSPEAFAVMAESLGADVIGANCSLGIEGICKAVAAISKVCSLPLIAQPNAGIPVLKGTETVFPASPEEMAAYVPRLVEAGVRILGGCCGTTPEHIKMMGEAFRGITPAAGRKAGFTALSSRSSVTLFGAGLSPIIIGERINPTGRKVLAQEIKEGKTAGIRNEARQQETAGANALDVNVGVPGIDEVFAMGSAVFAVNGNSSLPIVIDSSSPEAVLAGLKAVDGKPLINSISGEEKKLTSILPLAAEYGAAVLGLTLDDDGIPETAEGRLKVAEKMLERALKAGLRKEDLIVDCLAMTVSAAPESAKETLKAIRLVKERLGLTTVLGVSNISFGLPAREVINASFLTMAIEAGLDAAIINPNNKAMMDAFHASLVLLNKDLRAERYIKRHQALTEAAVPKEAAAAPSTPAPAGLVERLKKAVVHGDEENIVGLVEEALKEGWEPMKISNEALVPGLEEVGRLFASNRYYLPQVMLSADTMKKAFARLKKEIHGKKGASLGRVLLATVEGDIHDIGKNIVATLLENHGFEVIDLGKNVPSDRIVEEAEKNKVDIVGLSALMTTTVLEMDIVIKRLKEKGIKALTIVGGAVVTQEFSDKIGADQYGGDALGAIDKIKRMVGQHA
ncbi:MAG TPA: 5-methyltetrahydrofolate--homocysteine methyltransferase [Deltaproteobacteria bacterium]|nr:MAG: 5-methyltetrahydrofolate--homocysteine methyltransferase [Deltaproteobacteria bacterium GWA2_55_82]OGQ65022.1 MAG: 5-methyltetrahydrofolate--homocysteine methyltransferase [Deltaproteobacteria bacterium RIFCSPLOWO2_02_FULL_55_12]OIJ73790.1 MAG: 5-methyltetrahydrofolate--homocysteine methyltransferase [Deltaproteobacteria bacterium GWC2_55_46]HBG45807.1 5-methyltetrahydrofolate--homocysteine methyltransferase [Deltaproteobacteria bacterium]HCY09774.1 5-methyltetrahydrofolate--homocystein